MKSVTPSLVNIDIPGFSTFMGFIDERGREWIALNSLVDSFNLSDKIYVLQLSKIRRVSPESLFLQPLFIDRKKPMIYLIDKDFFLNEYLVHSVFWEKNGNIFPIFWEIKKIAKYKNEINKFFSKAFSESSSNFEIDNNLFGNAVNINFDELSKAINTAIENSLPKIINSISDLFLKLAPGPGTKHYYADKLTTAQPDSDKYFSIRDFLIEKKISLVFLKLFGGVVASHYGKVAIKYIPPNGNEKSSKNYYPITYKPLVEALLTKFLQSFYSNKEAVL